MAACAPRSAAPPPSPQSSDPCRITADSAGQLDTFRVALPESVDLSHAPVPTNDSERLLFRQLFPTLVRIDCQGEIRPEVAGAWSHDSSSRTWRFSMRDTSLTSGGSPVRAGQVLTAWRNHPELLRTMGIDSVVATDARTLVIGVRDAPAEDGKLFAEPALAVTPNSGPTLSTGTSLTIQGVGSTVLDFVTASGDLRDLLDSGVDLLVTRDLGLVEYAAGHRDLRTFPLPWSRTYVLVQPSTADSLRVAINADSVRTSLARDAVKADARPAAGGWTAAPCRSRAPVTAPRPAARIVYLARDSVARGLAERIVALDSQNPEVRAVGLPDSLLDASLRTGSNRGYIVALSSAAENICSSGLIPGGALIHPLIETRAHAIVRRGSPELTVDWDGIPRLAVPADRRARR